MESAEAPHAAFRLRCLPLDAALPRQTSASGGLARDTSCSHSLVLSGSQKGGELVAITVCLSVGTRRAVRFPDRTTAGTLASCKAKSAYFSGFSAALAFPVTKTATTAFPVPESRSTSFSFFHSSQEVRVQLLVHLRPGQVAVQRL